MPDSPLKVVSVESMDNSKQPKKSGSTLQQRRQEAQAMYERLWKVNPELFDPMKDCVGRERIRKTLKLLKEHIDLSGKKAADLGFGQGVLTKEYASAGASVDAVDIATQPINNLKKQELKGVRALQDYVPHTKLSDSTYDLVAATELIADLFPQEYRLFFSELGRLIKKDGIVLCSTPLDIYSEDALDRFMTLANTELEIFAWTLSRNYLWIKLNDVLNAPDTFGNAVSNNNFRLSELNQRQGINLVWFQINSFPLIGHIWKVISFITNPIKWLVDQQRWLMVALEHISEFFWSDRSVSHVIFLARRRPLDLKPEPKDMPPERQIRRRVWE